MECRRLVSALDANVAEAEGRPTIEGSLTSTLTLSSPPPTDPTALRLSASAVAPAGPADEVLVRRLKDGDATAGAELVRRYEGVLMGYLRRLAGSDHLAEELHQATWLSALEHLDKFDAAGSAAGGFKAWVFRIATNKANDWWRRSGREQAAKSGLRLVDEGSSEPVGSSARISLGRLTSARATAARSFSPPDSCHGR